MSLLPESSIIAAVVQAYSEKAKCGSNNDVQKVTESVGYSPTDLASIPAAAQLGLGCGSPVNAANLKEGEIVVDLGSGGGIDVLLSASKVGAEGQAIWIDASTDMIALARSNAAKKGLKPPHVAFVQASLAESLPIASNTVNCVLSNCVIKLLSQGGKATLLKEVYRILKPGGRIILDDVSGCFPDEPLQANLTPRAQILAKQPLPDEIRNDLTSYVNCISGSIQVEEYQQILQAADPQFLETKNDLRKVCSGVNGTCGVAPKPKFDVNTWVASYQIIAYKSTEIEDTADSTPVATLLRWWDAYPKVKSCPAVLAPEALANLIRGGSGEHHFAVVDVRRNDHAGGHVRGSDNWAAQTFYDDLPKFLEKYRNTSQVIFYCGSSAGRGPRCAGWYQDYLNEAGVTTSKSYVLEGGVKAWLAKYRAEEDLVDSD
ncbi:hypothetical protein DXG03_004809 [Asterophora parasitica]|uniref:Arsenite methyltransferase n=1 Tax=Asterophora parasitica TaxID=117018 RepID=A0A9P7K9X3_9AGAR|nr:hypothetical protein DXG03_004809 [Asterophora parasitica]